MDQIVRLLLENLFCGCFSIWCMNWLNHILGSSASAPVLGSEWVSQETCTSRLESV